MTFSSLVLPLLLAGTAAIGLGRRVDIYAALTRGAEEGLHTLLRIVPALVGLLTAVGMFRASGAMELFSGLLAPVLTALGIPAETAPLMLVRPVSGSGALAVATDLITRFGPDSYIGRRDAGQHGDHVLHHRRLFRLRRHPPDPPRRPGGTDRGPGGICRLRVGGAPVLSRIKPPLKTCESVNCFFSANSLE